MNSLRKWTRNELRHRRPSASTGLRYPLVFSVCAILLLTLLPASTNSHDEARNAFCVPCGDFAVEDALLNVLLFVPFGLSLRLLGKSYIRIVITGLLMSASIELLQLVIPGRDSSLRDVVTNTIGAGLGALLWSHWRAILLPSVKTAPGLAVGAVLCWLALSLGTVWSFQPSLPERAYFGQWAPADVYPSSFRGSILSATVNSVDIPAGRSLHSASLRQALGADSSSTQVVAEFGAAPEELSSIVSVADDRHREITLIGQKGTALVFRRRMRASELKLRNFGITLTNASIDSGDVLTIEWSRSPRMQSIRVQGPHGIQRRSVSTTPRLGWTLFVPFSPILGPSSDLIAATWLVLMVLPTGYYAGASYATAPRFAIPVLLAGIVLPLWAPVVAFNVAVPGMWDWGPSAIGAATGWALWMIGAKRGRDRYLAARRQSNPNEQ